LLISSAVQEGNPGIIGHLCANLPIFQWRARGISGSFCALRSDPVSDPHDDPMYGMITMPAKTTKVKSTTAKAKAKETAKPAVKAASKAKKAPAKAKAKSAKSKAAAKKSGNSGHYHDFVPYSPKRGEVYMNEAQRDHFRAILLHWKSELMQEVDRTVSHMKDEAANFPDPADRATQEEEFSLELRTRDRERKLIKKIDKTIDMIDADDYGYCDTCGVDIGMKRLEARPTATLCIDCKTLDEIKEKQERG
jgi:DnaK suppressor protein